MRIGVEKLDDATKRCLQTFRENISKAEDASSDLSKQLNMMPQIKPQAETKQQVFAPKPQEAGQFNGKIAAQAPVMRPGSSSNMQQQQFNGRSGTSTEQPASFNAYNPMYQQRPITSPQPSQQFYYNQSPNVQMQMQMMQQSPLLKGQQQ